MANDRATVEHAARSCAAHVLVLTATHVGRCRDHFATVLKAEMSSRANTGVSVEIASFAIDAFHRRLKAHLAPDHHAKVVFESRVILAELMSDVYFRRDDGAEMQTDTATG